ncbi:hypothetical protein [Limosilactobacillus ingluviei]|uniref:hypothetical protein n=1 Tax=Limosilactobacillus ingluviei TaxID=148604 RepID=UPI0023F26712|nr:hypothetical protein [Limosilactobacillus ingluviei]
MAFGLIHALQAQGMPQKQIVEALALARITMSKWRELPTEASTNEFTNATEG